MSKKARRKHTLSKEAMKDFREYLRDAIYEAAHPISYGFREKGETWNKFFSEIPKGKMAKVKSGFKDRVYKRAYAMLQNRKKKGFFLNLMIEKHGPVFYVINPEQKIGIERA